MSGGAVHTPGTPLPWAIRTIDESHGGIETAGGEFAVAQAQHPRAGIPGLNECKANAAYIVYACNAYPAMQATIDGLVGALEDVLDGVGALSNLSEFPNCLSVDEARGIEILDLIAKHKALAQ